MKKYIIPILVICFGLSIPVFPVCMEKDTLPAASAGREEFMTVYAENQKADPLDSDITVPISIKNNSGFAGFSFCVNYDRTRLELKSVEIIISDGYKVVNCPEGYDLGLAWTSDNEVIDDVTIALLHFSVKDNAAPGRGFVNIVFRPFYDSFYTIINYEEQDILCQIQNGFVEIDGKITGDVNKDGEVNNKDVVFLFRYVSIDANGVESGAVYDFNEDGYVDNKDVVALFRYIS